jgi:hypothetical protein
MDDTATILRNAARATAHGYTALKSTELVDAYTSAFEKDLEIANAASSALLAKPLWPNKAPSEILALWGALKRDLIAFQAGFNIWTTWYEDRLAGKPLDLELERQWMFLPDEIFTKSPAEINRHLTALRDARSVALTEQSTETRISANDVSSTQPPPELPAEQQPGPQFAIRADGKIDLRPSGLAPSDDLAEISAIRSAIIEALDDLTALLEGSNAYGTIARVAMRYKAAISADELSIDLLYANGLRLENARARLNREIKNGDCPDLAPQAGEALDSVIALHGPTVYSTARGRESGMKLLPLISCIFEIAGAFLWGEACEDVADG